MAAGVPAAGSAVGLASFGEGGPLTKQKQNRTPERRIRKKRSRGREKRERVSEVISEVGEDVSGEQDAGSEGGLGRPKRQPAGKLSPLSELARAVNEGKGTADQASRHPDQVTEQTVLAPAPKPQLLTRSFIYKHLKGLNEGTEPVLEREAFLEVNQRVVKRVLAEGWLQKPLDEVWEEAAQVVIVGALVEAKWKQRKDQGEEEEVEEQVERESGIPEAERTTFNMGTPYLGHFLTAINGFVQVKNEAEISSYLVLEPPFSDHYGLVIRELKQTYPKGAEDALEQKCSQSLSAAREGEDGAPWTQFIKFMVQYLSYMREVDADESKYLLTYDLLSELQVRANSALTHATLGYLVLPTVVNCARLVCRLAIGLDKRPELIAQLKSAQPGGASMGEDGGARETLPERAANTLRTGFVTCLNDRFSGINKTTGRPEGKKRGIYTIANLCLKILFQCRKTRNATQIFSNISNLSPPLAAYPKRERVTYLYYLGRFYWQNSHFYRAARVLQLAYDLAPVRPDCVRQRRQILVYLIASNILLGRFPSADLLSRPEAQGLADRFLPICFAIRSGDLAAFRAHLDFDGQHADWFLHFRILLQLRNRAEVLVWRSLVRKVFLVAGVVPNADGNSRAAPTVGIPELVAAWRWMERRSLLQQQQQQNGTSAQPYIDADFAGLDLPPDDSSLVLPDSTSLESILSSLLDQNLLSGFISHKQQKFAITGSKSKGGPLKAGFPNVAEVIRKRAEGEGQGGVVPGWKQEEGGAGGAGGGGGGQVIRMSGARPVGVS